MNANRTSVLLATDILTAARVVQDAVDAAQTGDSVFAAGGVYASGRRAIGTNLMVKRLAVDRAVTNRMAAQATVVVKPWLFL